MKSIVWEVVAVARAIISRAGWDPDEPDDDTERNIKHIYAEAAEYVEIARLAREGCEPDQAARQVLDAPVETIQENAKTWDLQVDGMNERGSIDGGVAERLRELNPWRNDQ